MANKPFSNHRFTLLDGAMGTRLRSMGLDAYGRPEELAFTAPEALCDLHKDYIDAGADIVYANTFGVNQKTMAGSCHTASACITQSVRCAKKACEGTFARVALDIGPIGELLQPLGTLPFEEAYALFAEVVAAGAAAGADLIVIETMTDLYEAKAALLAAKENSHLPVMVSMSFEENGRSLSGTSVEAMAACLAPLGADALGINCSLGPKALVPLAMNLCKASPVPVFIKPNAGLPNPETGEFALSAQAFCQDMEAFLSLGVVAMGGCCGTAPEHIQGLFRLMQNKKPAPSPYQPTAMVSSGTRTVPLVGVCPVGEKINPTGKMDLLKSLQAGDLNPLLKLAKDQAQQGAAILDIHVGAAGVEETSILPQAVKMVQAVCDLPLVLDSGNPVALEHALRVYNGRPLVNSTSGEAEKMKRILPLCKRYGAAVIGLTLDEGGIPETAEARVVIAKRILNEALLAGLSKEDVFIDCLTLAVGTGVSNPAETVKAVRLVKEELGLKTVLGISNVSFGLPNRPLLNRSFLLMALQAGLDLPILNPEDADMMEAILAFSLLNGQDKDAKKYLASFEQKEMLALLPMPELEEKPLFLAIQRGLRTQAVEAVRTALEKGEDGMELLENQLVSALDALGEAFESGELFLPQLLAGAEAAKAASEVIRAAYPSEGSAGPCVVVATVQGDVHDIGKNIAKALLENYGFNVIDLGRDVAPETVLQAVQANDVKLVGLSALMTTTLPAMHKTVQQLREKAPGCKVMVGGAVLTEAYAQSIGADFWVQDAQKSVKVARAVYGKPR